MTGFLTVSAEGARKLSFRFFHRGDQRGNQDQLRGNTE